VRGRKINVDCSCSRHHRAARVTNPFFCSSCPDCTFDLREMKKDGYLYKRLVWCLEQRLMEPITCVVSQTSFIGEQAGRRIICTRCLGCVFFARVIRNEWIPPFIPLCVSGSAQVLHAVKEASVRLKMVRRILYGCEARGCTSLVPRIDGSSSSHAFETQSSSKYKRRPWMPWMTITPLPGALSRRECLHGGNGLA
jgi:hypothetical protein